ncbi:MAG: EutN/CcmL family microcompartment protein [Planctomycetes bacterium]|nr:EutN/CcmL family microcompartment protein [Planctomycetota bacterium]
MLLGRVVGEVWATRKDPRVENMKFLVVRQIGLDRVAKPSFVVAVDTVGAGPGELVLVAQGSSARQSEQTTNRPVDAVVMAILDDLSVDERDWEAFDRADADS